MKKKEKFLDPAIGFEEGKKNEVRLSMRSRIESSSIGMEDGPSVEVGNDEKQYFNPEENRIHLGILGVILMFAVKTVEELYSALTYVFGHEMQHRRSTASIPYRHAIESGVREIVEYISEQVEGRRIRFRSSRDIQDYIEIDLPSKGIYIRADMIVNLVAGITNSLEDGRIERIRSAIYAEFRKLRIIFRGRFWENAEDVYPSYPEIEKNPGERLRIIMNQILSLATCQLYQKGFVMAYAGTPMMEQVNATMPFIARAVMSGKTRGLEPEVKGLCAHLAPLIYEAAKMTEKDLSVKAALEKMLADLIKSLIENAPDSFEVSERDEETDEGSADSTFPHSDLVITLEDEVYDKLKKAGKTGGEEGGIMIRREHPEPEKEEREENVPKKTDSGESRNTGGEKERPEGERGSQKAGGETDGENDGSSAPEEGEGSQNGAVGGSGSTGSGESGREETGEAGQEGRSSEDGSHSGASGKSEPGGTAGRDGAAEGKGSTEGGKESGEASEEAMRKAEEMIRKAIRSAEEQAAVKADVEISQVNQSIAREKTLKTGENVADDEEKISNKSVKGIMGDNRYSFRETLRDYEIDSDLPPVLSSRGKTLHRKNERYFKSLRLPTVHGAKSGTLDAPRLAKLAMGNTSVFLRRGKSKGFDGCAYILIDNSGSMYSGKKFKEACSAAAVIEEGFKGLIPLKITSFSDTCGVVIHQRIKGWKESQHRNCCWNYFVHKSPGGGNADGCSIAVATQELLKRPEQKKLLVVLSDGQPTEGSSNPVRLTQEKVAYARKKGIKVVGIYFENGAIGRDADIFRRIYGEADGICCTTQEIDKNLSAIFEKFSRS